MNPKLKKNSIVEIFLDYQRQCNSLGKAKLLQYKKTGYPFILEDYQIRVYYSAFDDEYYKYKESLSDNAVQTYMAEEWVVEFITDIHYPIGFTKTCKIRVPHRIGIAHTGMVGKKYLLTDLTLESTLLRDNFEIVPGWGQCF